MTTDATTFETIKQDYANDATARARQHLALHALVEHDQATSSPNLARDASNLALFDLACADLKADQGDGQAAGILHSEALNMMRSAKKAGGNTSNLEDIAQKVARKI